MTDTNNEDARMTDTNNEDARMTDTDKINLREMQEAANATEKQLRAEVDELQTTLRNLHDNPVDEASRLSAEVERLRSNLAALENTVCFENHFLAIPHPGDQVRAVDAKRLGDVMAEVERLRKVRDAILPLVQRPGLLLSKGVCSMIVAFDDTPEGLELLAALDAAKEADDA